VEDAFGNPLEVRALVDQGSETSIVTEKLVQRLKLPRWQASVSVIGAGDVQTCVAKGRVSLRVTSRVKQIAVMTNAIILPRITCYRGVPGIRLGEWPHIRGLELADPEPASADQIDVLLGADVYADIM